MKKTLKYIFVASIMMFVGITTSKAGIAHDCKYVSGNNYVHLQTMDNGGAASTYRISSVTNNNETVKLPDSNNTYGNKECPSYILYEWQSFNSNVYGKSTSDSKQKLQELVEHDGITKYFIAPLTLIDDVPVDVLEKEKDNDSSIRICEYGVYKVYVDKNNKKAYVTGDMPSMHTQLPTPYVDYSWFKEGCPYKIYSNNASGNYLFSNESALGFEPVALTSNSGGNNSDGKKDSEEKKSLNCDNMSETVTLFKSVYRTLRYLIPVIIIVFSIIDFVKVVANGDDKEYKTAWNKFIKRIVIGIIILILPQILKAIIIMSGALGMYNIDENSIFCALV